MLDALSDRQACLFVPDGTAEDQALERTTHLGVGAHPDDLEFMCWHPILECYRSRDAWFTGVIATDGRASPRTGLYAGYSDDAMVATRLKEQQQAAVIGEYAAAISLMHSEQGPVMQGQQLDRLVDDLTLVLQACRPRWVYTHNPIDRHDHHVALVVATVAALRRLGPHWRPRGVFGCEVWRGLDWLSETDRQAFDVGSHPNLTAALMGVYDSQISGGKRYDLATAGRKRANATYNDPYVTDQAEALEFAVDLSPLLDGITVETFVAGLVRRLEGEVTERVQRFARRVQ